PLKQQPGGIAEVEERFAILINEVSAAGADLEFHRFSQRRRRNRATGRPRSSACWPSALPLPSWSSELLPSTKRNRSAGRRRLACPPATRKPPGAFGSLDPGAASRSTLTAPAGRTSLPAAPADGIAHSCALASRAARR